MIRTNNDIASLRKGIGSRLAFVRNERGLLQSEMAAEIGISPRSYQNYELGIREAPADVIRRLSDKFGIDGHWVLTGEGGPYYMDASQVAKDALKELLAEIEQLGLQPDPQKLPDILAIMVKQTTLLRSLNPPEIQQLVKLACNG